MNGAQARLDTWLDSWPERLKARDDAFIERLVAEIAALDALGYSRMETLQALGGRLYVRTWAACPRWLEWLNKLPSGLKWIDGTTYKQQRKTPVRTLAVGNALLMSYRGCDPVGSKRGEKVILVVHDFRTRTLPELLDGLPNGGGIDWALTLLARDNGLRLTNNPGILRDFRHEAWDEARQ